MTRSAQRPGVTITVVSAITMEATGDAGPRLLRKAGVASHRALDRRAAWLFPSARLSEVVAAARTMRVDIVLPAEVKPVVAAQLDLGDAA